MTDQLIARGAYSRCLRPPQAIIAYVFLGRPSPSHSRARSVRDHRVAVRPANVFRGRPSRRRQFRRSADSSRICSTITVSLCHTIRHPASSPVVPLCHTIRRPASSWAAYTETDACRFLLESPGKDRTAGLQRRMNI